MIQSKLPLVGTNIFSVMSGLAADVQAINLSQGFPDYAPDPVLIELVYKAMNMGYNQYAPMPGILPLREVIAEKVEDLYQQKYDPQTEITITAGGTQALYCAIAALVHPSDEVIIFEPAYDSYGPTVELHGGTPIYISLQYPNYTIHWEEVKSKITPKTKLIILNTPHNPTGTMLKEEDMIQLQEIANNHPLYFISDEVYEHITFDEQPHLSFSKYPILKEKTYVIASFGKVLHTTGWKLGYCLAPEYLMNEFRKIHQYNVFAANTPMQWAIAQYFQSPKNYLQLPRFFEHKRDFFVQGMKSSPFKLLPSKGTYFINMDYSNTPYRGMSDLELAKHLTTSLGVATIPVSAFYHSKEDNKVLRICFAKKEETLLQAFERFNKVSNQQ